MCKWRTARKRWLLPYASCHLLILAILTCPINSISILQKEYWPYKRATEQQRKILIQHSCSQAISDMLGRSKNWGSVMEKLLLLKESPIASLTAISTSPMMSRTPQALLIPASKNVSICKIQRRTRQDQDSTATISSIHKLLFVKGGPPVQTLSHEAYGFIHSLSV